MAKLVEFVNAGVKVNTGTSDNPIIKHYRYSRPVPTTFAITEKRPGSAILASLEESGPVGIRSSARTVATGFGLINRATVHVGAKGGGGLNADTRANLRAKLSADCVAKPTLLQDYMKAGFADSWLVARYPQDSGLAEISESEAKLLNAVANKRMRDYLATQGVEESE